MDERHYLMNKRCSLADKCCNLVLEVAALTTRRYFDNPLLAIPDGPSLPIQICDKPPNRTLQSNTTNKELEKKKKKW